jgi:hypothetical protein
MLTFDQERPSPGFPLPLRYWRIKGNRGLLMHTFLTGMLALIDFATLAPNHADCLDLCDIENDYVAKNCTDSSRIHVVQDSDEFILASLTPKSVNWAPPPPVRYYAPGWLTEIERLSNIRESMKFYATANGDHVKRDLFARPIRWHRGDIDDVWTQEERRIERSIKLAVGDYYNLGTVRKNGPSRVRDWLLKSPGAYRAIIHFCVLISIAFSRLSELGRRMWLAMRGDPAARNWVSWRVQVFWRQLQGHKTHPPRPDVP